MQLQEGIDQKTKKQLHQVPHISYKNDPNWAAPLQGMVEGIFDLKKNKTFRNGKAIRWILIDDNGNLVGRIAAFINFNLAKTYEQPTGGCGFFECIDDQEAANKLFKAAADWNKENGMEAMDGPVNFDENFFFWGLLKDGFRPQTFGMNYNPQYYNDLFTAYGFKTYYEQYSYSLDVTNPDLPDRFWKIAEWVAKKPGYSFEHFSMKNQDKYIRDFIEIHEKAWGNHGNYKPIKFELLKDLLSSAKIILDEEFICYAYHTGKPIAFFMKILDLNQIIQKLKTGNLSLWQGLKLLYLTKRKTITRCRVIVLGVVPGYQCKGIESAIFHHMKKVMLRKSWYDDMEMSWIGDFNPKMNAMFKSFGADRTQTHCTLRYLFNREKEFVRAPIIE